MERRRGRRRVYMFKVDADAVEAATRVRRLGRANACVAEAG